MSQTSVRFAWQSASSQNCADVPLRLPHGALPLGQGFVPQDFVMLQLSITTFQGMKWGALDDHGGASLENKYSRVGLSTFGMEV